MSIEKAKLGRDISEVNPVLAAQENGTGSKPDGTIWITPGNYPANALRRVVHPESAPTSLRIGDIDFRPEDAI